MAVRLIFAAMAMMATTGAALAQSPQSKPVTPAKALNPMAVYYPGKAKAAKLGGVVMVACTLKADARFEACRVLREMPAGYGFGAATLKMVSDIGQGDLKVNKPGDEVQATIKWQYSPEP